jgi:microcystin-dependent protein
MPSDFGAFGVGVISSTSGKAGAVNYSTSPATGPVDADHTHNYSGNTGNANVDHTHSIATDGASGTNANLPPYLGINFIIKT